MNILTAVSPLFAVLAILTAFPTDINADGTASSADYSFDYSSVSAGAAETVSTDYSVIGITMTEGVADKSHFECKL